MDAYKKLKDPPGGWPGRGPLQSPRPAPPLPACPQKTAESITAADKAQAIENHRFQRLGIAHDLVWTLYFTARTNHLADADLPATSPR